MTTNCPLCDNACTRPFYRESGRDYRRCDACGLLFMWPRPDAAFLAEHYQEYLAPEPDAVRDWGLEMRHVVRKTAAQIAARIGTSGRVLDIGCGYGFFLEEMALRGYQVEGVELSKPAAAIAREKTGATIHDRAIEDIEPAEQFDAITMFYVIEHVTDPLGVLRTVRSMLRPGGLLVLRYPNTTPIIRLCPPLARKLTVMQAPSHIHDFAGHSMNLLLEQAGFTNFKTVTMAATRPRNLVKRGISTYTTLLSSILATLTRGGALLPGVSRTTFAANPARE